MKRIFTILIIAIALTGCTTASNNKASIIREDSILHPIRLSRAEKEAIIKYAHAVLDREFDIQSELPAIPEVNGYDKVFVTLYTYGDTRCSMRGKADREKTGWGKKDIESAVKRCVGDDRFGGKIKKEEIKNIDFEITYLHGKRKVDGGKDKLKAVFVPGIHGLGIKNGDKQGTFKESVPIHKQYGFNKTIRQLCKKIGLEPDCDQDKDTKFFIYDAVPFVKTHNYDAMFELYRQNSVFNVLNINKKLLVYRLGMVRDWFLQNINPSTGRLRYEYFPSEDRYEASGSSEIRLMATGWALAALQNKLKGKVLSPTINNMLDYYLKNMKCDVDEEFGDYCVLETDGGKIANNAFMLLTLTEFPQYPDSYEIKKKLAAGLLRQQKESGAFRTRFNSDGERGIDYYPGEAMLALMEYYLETKDERYLNAVNNAFPYYRKYWYNNKNTAFVAWQTRAYKILYEETKDKEVARFIFEMNDWLIANEQIQKSMYKDEIGGMPKPSPRYSTSVYMEGISDAYVVALEEGDQKRAKKYKNTIINGMRFLLLTQNVYSNSYYLPNKERAYGGFRYSLIKNNQRIDFAQHAVFAILKSLDSGVFN